MAFSAISWAYKEEATSTKLQQMVDNIVAHDHRADGTQGAPLIGPWVDCTTEVSAGSGFTKTGTQRYRLLLGGALVEWDFTVTKTSGADVVASNTAAAKPGALLDTILIDDIPAAGNAGAAQGIATDAGNTFLYAMVQGTGNRLVGSVSVPSGKLTIGDLIRMKGVLWR